MELLESLPAHGCGWVNADSLSKGQISRRVKSSLIFYKNNSEPLLGITPCILLAEKLGIKREVIQDAVVNIKRKTTRAVPVPGMKQSIIIDNSYNTSVEGCINMIRILGQRKEKRRMLVTRGIIELGIEKRASYDRILRTLSRFHVSLYTTDADFNLLHPHWVHWFSTESQLSEALSNELVKNTVIAFEGRYNKDFIKSLIANN